MERRIHALMRRRGRFLPSSEASGPGAPVGAPPAQLLDFDGPGADFTRSDGRPVPLDDGIATYLSGPAAVASAATDALRSETRAGVARYLFESDRQNVYSYSGPMTNGVGGSGGYGVNQTTRTYGVHDAPDGTVAGANEYGYNTHTSAWVYKNGTGFPDSSPATLSCWIRRISGGTHLRFNINDMDGLDTVGPDFVVTDTWQRYHFTVPDSGSGGSAMAGRVRGSSLAESITVALWGMSLTAERYPTTLRLNTTSARDSRLRDVLTYASAEVPLLLRTGAWTCNVRPAWATADLSTGERRVIASMTPADWVGFEEDGGSVYLRCYVAGVLQFSTGPLTTVRHTDYPIIVDLAAGVMTFDDTAGAAGTPAELPALALRWGGMAGVDDEFDGGTSEPWSV